MPYDHLYEPKTVISLSPIDQDLIDKIAAGSYTDQDLVLWLGEKLDAQRESIKKVKNRGQPFPNLKIDPIIAIETDEVVITRGPEGVDFFRYLASALVDGDTTKVQEFCQAQIERIKELDHLIMDRPAISPDFHFTSRLPLIKIYELLANLKISPISRQFLQSKITQFFDEAMS